MVSKKMLLLTMLAIGGATLTFAQSADDYLGMYEKMANEAIDQQTLAVEEYIRKEKEAIAKYQNSIGAALGINYSYDKDTTAIKQIVSAAVMDSVPAENLANAVKVLDSGIKSGANEDDAADIARLVSQENVKVTPEQTVAFSEARKIAKENNADEGQTDEILYNEIRKGKKGTDIIATVKNFIAEKNPLKNLPQSQQTQQAQSTPAKSEAAVSSKNVASGKWQGKMNNKVQEFVRAKTPYVWGGNSVKGVDCSGFTSICYKEIGVTIPRVSRDQFKTGKTINPKNAQFGDIIVFYADKNRGKVDHVGLVYENTNGNVRFVHSSRGKKGIGFHDLTQNSYWGRNFAAIKRVVE